MREKNKHLTWNERLNIELLQKLGYSASRIAKEIGCCRRTVYYELKRGEYERLDGQTWKTEKRYSPDIAEKKYRNNLKAKGAPLKIGNDFNLADYIEKRIVDDKLSPLAVIGEIRRKQLAFNTSICVSTLYSYIYKGVFFALEMKHLNLKSKEKSKKKKVSRKAAKACRGVNIEKRPIEINDRTSFGHWEMDCVCGRTKAVLLVLTERLTRKEIIFKMKNQKAASVIQCLNVLERRYGKHFRQVFKSITVDNGTEFSDVLGMERSIYRGKRIQIYYCHPYCSSERGSNERLNREIRRLIPKGSDIRQYSDKDIKEVEEWVNNYPRQIFNFATSNELFAQELKKISINCASYS